MVAYSPVTNRRSVWPLSIANMRLSLLVCSAVALATSVVVARQSDVISLSAEDFENAVNNEPLIVVNFGGPW